MTIKNSDLPYWVVLSQVDGVGPKNFFRLVKLFGSAKKVWLAKEGDFGAKKVQNSVKSAIFKVRDKVDPTTILDDLNKKSIQITAFFEKSYPKNHL